MKPPSSKAEEENVQKALLKKHVLPVTSHSDRQRPGTTLHADGESKKIVFSFLVVLVIHAATIAWLATRTTEYKPLNLITPAENVSIQVMMVDESETEPVHDISPALPVLTSEQGERETLPPVEKQPPLPEPPPMKKEVKKTVSKPRTVDKPKQVHPKTAKEPQPAAKTEQQATPVPATTATNNGVIPNAGKGVMMQNAPGAQPKSVTSVGCTVPQPEYPRRARRLQQEGEVLIRLVISPEGRLLKHELARSSGYQVLDEAAMTAISQTRCTPYQENGQAITVMTLQPVKFRLSD